MLEYLEKTEKPPLLFIFFNQLFSGEAYSTRNLLPTFLFKIPNFGQSYGTRNILPTFLFKSPIMGTTLQQVVELDGSCLLKGWLTLRPRGFGQCRAPTWLILE